LALGEVLADDRVLHRGSGVYHAARAADSGAQEMPPKSLIREGFFRLPVPLVRSAPRGPMFGAVLALLRFSAGLSRLLLLSPKPARAAPKLTSVPSRHCDSRLQFEPHKTD